MDKFLGQEIPEKERWQFLQDNADAVEEIGYTHRFTPDELAQKKESLAETSIKINDIEIEKKEAMEAFKADHLIGYEKNLIAKIGKQKFDMLAVQAHQTKKYSDFELQELIKYYQALNKKMLAEK